MTSKVSAKPVGETGLLIELRDNSRVQSLASHLREKHAQSDELREIVPGHDTLLVIGYRARPSLTLTDGWDPEGLAPGEPRHRTVSVVYDGVDLAGVAEECGLSVTEVIELHQSAQYSVAFTGFAPGFAYMLGGSKALRPARHTSPRARVPAGSVAMAGDYTAVYPTASPGGWKLIGRTEAVMFDPARDDPSYLAPGDIVTFVARYGC